jgi:hypothetical protein
MTIVTKGMGAIIKGIKRATTPYADVKSAKSRLKMFRDTVRKIPLKKKKSLLDITPRKISKSVNKDIKDAAKDISKLGDTVVKTAGKLVTNKTVGAGAIAAGTSAAVRNENKK